MINQKKKIPTLTANRFKLSHSKSCLQYADRTCNAESNRSIINSMNMKKNTETIPRNLLTSKIRIASHQRQHGKVYIKFNQMSVSKQENKVS